MNVELARLIQTTRRRKRRRIVLSSAPLAGTAAPEIGDNEHTMPKRGARVLRTWPSAACCPRPSASPGATSRRCCRQTSR